MPTLAAQLLSDFNDACNRHDVDAMMALMTPDCRFENTTPPPDGTAYEGHAAVRAFWETFFRTSPQAQFTIEETFTTGERGVQRWVYRWVDEDGASGYVRGVDVFRFRDGKIAEKLSYVKG
jgi:ketosteroid isomerase-like protein